MTRRLPWGEPPDTEDVAIARALVARDPGAHRAAWERFSPLVRRIVRRFMGPGCDTEDAVQDTFVCLFEKVPTLREPAALRAFVMAVTLRTAQYHARRRRTRRFVGLPDGDAHPALRVVEDNPEPRLALERFYRILDRVNDADRAAFVLRYIEGLELSEVARALGTSPPTARRRFTRAYGRISLLASRDPLLTDYLAKKEKASAQSLQIGAS